MTDGAEQPCTHEIIFEPETSDPGEVLACACGMYTATTEEFNADAPRSADPALELEER